MSAPFTPGTPAFLILLLVLAVCLVNLWTFFVFGLDKRRATRGEWRVPENTLLMLAFVGGWPGAKAAQRWFRHKTRKQPFALILNLIGVMQLALVIGLTVMVWTGGSPDLGRLSPVVTTLAGDQGPPERVLPRRFGPGSADWE